MTSEIVGILLLLQYKTFCNNLKCKWRSRCWLLPYSVSPQEWKYLHDKCSYPESNLKAKILVSSHVKFISYSLIHSARKITLVTDPFYLQNSYFWIAIETFSTSFINIPLYWSTEVHQPRSEGTVPRTHGVNSVSLIAGARLKRRSWAERWQCASKWYNPWKDLT